MAHDLDVETPNDLEIHLIRRFDASPRLVFEALTRPDLVRRWLLGPDGWSMPGGAYHYRWRNDESGQEFGFIGEYKEIEPFGRIVNSERPDDQESGDSLVINLIEAEGSGTKLTLVQRFNDKATRDMVLATGMAGGVARSYERLDEVLTEAA